MLANLYHDPYTAYIPGEVTGKLPNLSIEKVKHKRWLMRDISALENNDHVEAADLLFMAKTIAKKNNISSFRFLYH